MQRVASHGFHVGIVIVILAVIGVIVALVATFLHRQQEVDSPTEVGNVQAVKWAYNEQEQRWYVQQGEAPACKDPFVFDMTPVDLSDVMVIGMPGAYRGFNYKPHGGFRLVDQTNGKTGVRMPMDATLVGLKRYYEGDPAEIQYLLTFESDCGIAFRFDHLYTLTPAFQAIAQTTPEPKLNDSRTDPNAPFERTAFKAGDLIATEVGFPRTRNYGFDFGVYDYRSRNEISKDARWVQLHNTYQGQEWYGRCWIDMLPGEDAAKAKVLSLVVINPAKPNIISDYCDYAPFRTADFNDGKPTDG